MRLPIRDKNIVFCLALAFTALAFGEPRQLRAQNAVVEETEQTKTESVSIFGDGTLEVPVEFKRVQPKSMIVEHEFQAKSGEGDTEETARITMMASGGGVEPNIKRWQGQFTGGDEQLKKVEKLSLGDWKVHLVENNGTFAERMGGGPFAGGKVVKRKNHGMIGAILVHPQGKLYFVKMIGPNSFVQAKRDTFIDMIKTLEAN